MITEKEIIKEFKKSALLIRRFKGLGGERRTHYEFSIDSMNRFAKTIIEDLKRNEKQGFDLATVWQHEYFKLKKILEKKGLGKYIKSITLSGTAKGQEVRNDN